MSHSQYAITPPDPNKVTVIGPPGYIEEPERFAKVEDRLKAMGHNSGNLIFQYATTLLFDVDRRHVGFAALPYSDTSARRGSGFLIFPAANMLRMGTDWKHLCKYIRNTKLPIIVLGLGAQSSSLEGERETIDALRADESVMELVKLFADQAVLVTVRGDYTAIACKELGIPNVEVMGCPSAMINPDKTLGLTLERQLEALKSQKDIKAGLAAAAPYEIYDDESKLALERKMLSWLIPSGGGYLQQSGGEDIYRMSRGLSGELKSRVRKDLNKILAPDVSSTAFWNYIDQYARLFESAPEWFEYLKDHDMMIGTRIHGNMAGLAAGIPGVLIAHDSRTGELGRTMKLPTASSNALLEAESLSDLVKKVQFDGGAFDQWRKGAARRYIELFEKVGIKPNMKHFNQII